MSEESGFLPRQLKFGSTVLCPDLYNELPNLPKKFDLKQHMIKIYNFFREELVDQMQRLWLMYSDSQVEIDQIDYHMKWGDISLNHARFSLELHNHLQYINANVNNANVLEDNVV